jgi:hypothetical protein
MVASFALRCRPFMQAGGVDPSTSLFSILPAPRATHVTPLSSKGARQARIEL